MPDNPTFPAITFETTVGDQVESFTGYSNLSNPIVSFHAWAATHTAARALITLIRDAIIGASWTHGDRTVDNVLEWSSVDLYDPEVEVFHVSASCRVWYY